MNWIWEYINPSNDYLGAIIGMIMSIIALALPISQSTISDRLATYHNKHILEMFKSERTYKAMLFSILLLIVTLVLSILFNEESESTGCKLVGLLCLFTGLASVIIFWLYFRRTNQYAINTDSVVFNYCKKKMVALTDSRGNTKEKWELLEIAACVIEHKEKSGNYAEVEEIVKFLEDGFMAILKDKGYVNDEKYKNLWDYSLKYYSLYFDLWKNCYRKSPSTAVMLMNAYNRVVKYAILQGEKEEGNLGLPPYAPLFYLYQQMAATLKPEDIKTPRTADYCWKWYFEVVLSDDFPVERVFTANTYLLTVMKNIVDYDILYVFKAYVAHIIDSNIISKFEDFGITNDWDKDLKLRNLQYEFHRIVQFNEHQDALNELESIGVEEDTKAEVNKRINRRFVYNNIQFVTLLIGSYGLFRKKYDFVKALIYYNQPLDSEALFVNKDIIPESFDDLVRMYMKASDRTMQYFTIWPGHHDITHCYKQFLHFLTFVLVYNKNANIRVNVADFNDNLQQQLSYLQHVIEQFKNAINNFSDKELNKLDILDSGDIKNKIQLELNAIKAEFEKIENANKQWQMLDDEKVDGFKREVIEQTKNNSLWARVFKENDLEGGAKWKHKIGLITFLEKSFLAENDKGMYVGFSQNFSGELIRQIDSYVEMKLRAQNKQYPFSEFRISEDDFKRKVLDFDKDFSAAFINVYDYHEAIYDAPGFQWIWEGDKVGITGKGCSIYYFGDQGFSAKRLVVFNKHFFSRLEITIPDGGFKVVDLNTSREDREKLYNSSSLRGMANDDEKDEELKKCVLVEIQGEMSFYMKDNAEIAYVEEK